MLIEIQESKNKIRLDVDSIKSQEIKNMNI